MAQGAPVEPTGKVGRGTKFEPTLAEKSLVMMAAAAAISDEIIARLIRSDQGGIAESTLQKHFAHELKVGRARVQITALSTLFAQASNINHPKSTTASIFIMKALANWRDGSGLAIDAAVRGGKGEDGEDRPFEFTLKIGDNEPTEEE